MPRTTVVMLTWNALQFTQISLNSLFNSKEDFDLIIFDNGSNEETKKYLQSITNEPRLKQIIYSNKNLGVWQGRYQAVQKVSTELLCFIDNDVYFPSNWLKSMEKMFRDDLKLGEVGPLKLSKHLRHPYKNSDVKSFWHECERTESNPQKQLTNFTMGRNFDQFVKDVVSANKKSEKELEIPTRSIGGSIMMTRTDLYNNSQLNDNTYSKFKYGLEDMDYSWSLFDAGYKVLKCTDVYVHHFEHSSVGDNNLKIDDKGNNQGLIYFTSKWKNLIIDWVNQKKLSGISLEKIKNDEFISLILRAIFNEIPHELKNALQI